MALFHFKGRDGATCSRIHPRAQSRVSSKTRNRGRKIPSDRPEWEFHQRGDRARRRPFVSYHQLQFSWGDWFSSVRGLACQEAWRGWSSQPSNTQFRETGYLGFRDDKRTDRDENDLTVGSESYIGKVSSPSLLLRPNLLRLN